MIYELSLTFVNYHSCSLQKDTITCFKPKHNYCSDTDDSDNNNSIVVCDRILLVLGIIILLLVVGSIYLNLCNALMCIACSLRHCTCCLRNVQCIVHVVGSIVFVASLQHSPKLDEAFLSSCCSSEHFLQCRSSLP